jgi:hypothetical protein
MQVWRRSLVARSGAQMLWRPGGGGSGPSVLGPIWSDGSSSMLTPDSGRVVAFVTVQSFLLKVISSDAARSRAQTFSAGIVSEVATQMRSGGGGASLVWIYSGLHRKWLSDAPPHTVPKGTSGRHLVVLSPLPSAGMGATGLISIKVASSTDFLVPNHRSARCWPSRSGR